MGVYLMAGELDELSVAIGGLRADVKNLARTVHSNQEASTDEHRKVHDIVVATSEAVRNRAAKVAEMEPLTDDYREKRAEARGARRLIHLFYVSAGGVAGALATQVMAMFGGKPPHP
jgi:hypothetical protein